MILSITWSGVADNIFSVFPAFILPSGLLKSGMSITEPDGINEV